jgi:hypothetical protein
MVPTDWANAGTVTETLIATRKMTRFSMNPGLLTSMINKSDRSVMEVTEVMEATD